MSSANRETLGPYQKLWQDLSRQPVTGSEEAVAVELSPRLEGLYPEQRSVLGRHYGFQAPQVNLPQVPRAPGRSIVSEHILNLGMRALRAELGLEN